MWRETSTWLQYYLSLYLPYTLFGNNFQTCAMKILVCSILKSVFCCAKNGPNLFGCRGFAVDPTGVARDFPQTLLSARVRVNPISTPYPLNAWNVCCCCHLWQDCLHRCYAAHTTGAPCVSCPMKNFPPTWNYASDGAHSWHINTLYSLLLLCWLFISEIVLEGPMWVPGTVVIE